MRDVFARPDPAREDFTTFWPRKGGLPGHAGGALPVLGCCVTITAALSRRAFDRQRPAPHDCLGMSFCERTIRRIRHPRAMAAGLSLVVVGYGISAVGRQLSTGNDLPTYLDAARMLLDGRSPYAPGPGLEGYVYPPFFALALSPLAFLPDIVSVCLWYAWNVALTVVSVLLTRALVRSAAGERYATWAAALSLLVHSRFFLSTYDVGQVNILILCLLLWSAKLAVIDGHSVRAGWPLGFAAAIKPHAIVLLAPFLVRRRWGMAAGVAAAVVVAGLVVPLLILGVGETHVRTIEWYERVVVPARMGVLQGSAAHDQSPEAALRRLFVGDPAFDDVRVNLRSLSNSDYHRMKLVLQAVLGLVLVAAWLRRPRAGRMALLVDVALAFVGMLVLFGYLTRSHFVMLLLPGASLALLWRRRSRALPGRRVSSALLAVAGALIFFTTPTFVGRTLQQWALAYSVVTVATLTELALLVLVRFRLGGDDEGAGEG